MLIADMMAPYVNALFAHAGHLCLVVGMGSGRGLHAATVFRLLSGYRDIAVGLALFLLGFRFPQNFDSPYKAVNISRLLAALEHVTVLLVA